MLNRIRLCALAAATLIGAPCFADVPSSGLYLIKTKVLKQELGSKHDLSKIPSRDLRRMAECVVSLGHGYLSSFYFSTPVNEFSFSTSDDSMPPPIGSKGKSFDLEFKSKSKKAKSILLSGTLAFTNETLDTFDSVPGKIAEMPNTFIRVNQEWDKQEYTVILIFVNAKR